MTRGATFFFAWLVRCARLFCGAFFLVVAPCAQAAIVQQDGIVAQAHVADNAILLQWRFLQPLKSPLSSIGATLNGRPLPSPRISAYPDAQDRTVLVFLLDVSEGRSDGALRKDKGILLHIVSRLASHHVVALMTYAADAQIIRPLSGSLDDLVDAITGIELRTEKADRDRALAKALFVAGRVPSSRRGLFVLTDGRNDQVGHADDVVALARQIGATLTFIAVDQEGTMVDRAAIAGMARSTNGELVTENHLASFLDHPFALIDSGAEAVFPLDNAFRLPWERGGDVKVNMSYGKKTLVLSLAATPPVCSFAQLVGVVFNAPEFIKGTAALGFVLIGLTGSMVLVRRARQISELPPTRASGTRQVATTLATLEDIELGAFYPVSTPLVRIGRNKDNDIILDDPSVGRFHAVLQQIGDRIFSIVDQSSANGILINNKKVQSATLSHGDLISLGSKILRYWSSVTIE